MAKLVSRLALVGKQCKLEHPVRVFGYASLQSGAHVGRYSYINRYSFVHRGVRMGRFCSIGRGVDLGAEDHRLDLLSTHPFQYNNRHFDEESTYRAFPRSLSETVSNTHVGHDVWIGSNAVIATGVRIGTGAVVGASAFVKHDVEPYAVVGGTPARVLKYRFPARIVERLLASEWWDLHPHEMAGIDFDDIEKALDQIAALKAGTPLTEAGKSAPTLDPVLEDLLTEAMTEMDIPTEMAEIVLDTAAAAGLTCDLDDPNDQALYRNKLVALSQLALLAPEPGPAELKKARNLFQSKH